MILMHICSDLDACLDVDLGASLDVVQASSHDVLEHCAGELSLDRVDKTSSSTALRVSM